MGYAQRFLTDTADAEDVVQEVLLRLWDMRDGLERYDSVRALSFRITRNLCLDRLRVIRRNAGEEGMALQRSGELSPQVALEQKDGVDRVMGLMEGLPYVQRTVLSMKHVEGLEVGEIAELTGSSPEAVRMNLSRARRKIKELFMKTELI